MIHQPMGVSGIDLDIVTGRPREVKTREEHQAQEELKATKAMQEATQLSQELPAVLIIMARLYEQRLFELAKGDPFLRGLDMQATAYNLKLNFGPVSLPGRPWFHPSLSSKLPQRTADAAPRSLLNRPADGLR